MSIIPPSLNKSCIEPFHLKVNRAQDATVRREHVPNIYRHQILSPSTWYRGPTAGSGVGKRWTVSKELPDDDDDDDDDVRVRERGAFTVNGELDLPGVEAGGVGGRAHKLPRLPARRGAEVQAAIGVQGEGRTAQIKLLPGLQHTYLLGIGVGPWYNLFFK